MGFVAWVQAHWALIAGVVIALDTALAEIPQVQANSTFQLVTGIVKQLFGAKPAA